MTVIIPASRASDARTKPGPHSALSLAGLKRRLPDARLMQDKRARTETNAVAMAMAARAGGAGDEHSLFAAARAV
jgi:hypothetical protein